MRALLPIKSNINLLTEQGEEGYSRQDFSGKTHRKEFLQSILKSRNWVVDDDDLAQRILDYVIVDVSGEDAENVRGQWLLSIYSKEKNIQGIVSIRNSHFIEIRLRSSAISDVQELCSSLVQLFIEAEREARSSESGALVFAFSFPETAKIFSSHTKEQIWKGEIHPEDAKAKAFKEEHSQVITYNFARIIFIGSLIATFPPVLSHYINYLPADIGKWIVDFIERLPSAALLTAVFTRLALQTRIQRLRKGGFIYWTPI